MVDKKQINNSISYSVSVNKISNIIRDNIRISNDESLDLLEKCGDNRATRAGENAVVHMADAPDGVQVPLRHLQDKGYTEDGEHLGYVADIEYQNGVRIDYVNGYIRDENGVVHQMGFDDNFRSDGNGKLVHNPKGSANGMFKFQWQSMSADERRELVTVASLLKRPSLVNTIRELRDSGKLGSVDVENPNSPLGKLLSFSQRLVNGEFDGKDWTRIDVANFVVGEQVSKSDLSYRDVHNLRTVNGGGALETSVGMLNDKSLVVRNPMTGESRSVNGRVNNWDNTYKVYTLVETGSGAQGVYMGYPQNVKAGVWDNSGNPLNELDLLPNQHFEKVVVDKANGVIVQRIVSD